MANKAGGALSVYLQTNIPVLLREFPRSGILNMVVDLAEEQGWPLEVVIAAMHDPIDFGGLPVPSDDGTVHYVPQDWARRLADHKGPSILFLDEIDKASPIMQSALLPVVQERMVGDLYLGDEVRIIATTNHSEEGSKKLSASLADSFVRVDWRPSVTEMAEAILETDKPELGC